MVQTSESNVAESSRIVGDSVSRRSARVAHDHGNATIFIVAASLAIMAGVVLAIGRVGEVLVNRERARNAADAAALAAVIDGPSTAHAIAARHGATVVELRLSGDEATVIVVCDGQQATARATNRP